jgi:beta-lactamase class C
MIRQKHWWHFKCLVIGMTLIFSLSLTQTRAAEIVPSALSTSSQVPGDAPVFFNSLVQQQLPRWTSQVMSSGQSVGLAVAVVKDGKITFAHGYGLADINNQAPVTDETVFRLASLSKSIAASYAGLLVHEGYLDWHSRVQPLVPMFELRKPGAASLLTIRDLLSHRVGIPYNALDRVLEKSNEPFPTLLYQLRQLPMTCQVGTCYAYQNIAFSMIGDITFATSGDFFSYGIERKLFRPLEMDTASYGLNAIERSLNWAKPHVRHGSLWISTHPKENYYRVMPAAGVNASIRDLAKWMLAHLGHNRSVLPSQLLEELHTPQVQTPSELRSTPWRRERLIDAHYALGWRVYSYSGHRLLFHGGAVQGYRAMMALLPDHDAGIAVLWNCESALPSAIVPSFLDTYLGLPAVDWVTTMTALNQPKAQRTNKSKNRTPRRRH